MNKFFRRSVWACAAALVLSSCSLLPSRTPATTDVELVALNDFHGNIEASKYAWSSVDFAGERSIQAGGIDTLAAALQAWRKDDPELLLVGAGDLVGGSPAISSMWADSIGARTTRAIGR